MKKIVTLSLILFFTFSMMAAGIDRDEFVIQSRFFMGTRSADLSGPQVTVSSSVQPFILPLKKNLLAAERNDIASLQKELNTIYQLKHVEHLASAHMFWDGKTKNLNSTIFLDEQAIPINLSLKLISDNKINLRIEIFKLLEDKGSRTSPNAFLQRAHLSSSDINLLDTEIIMNIDQPIILGFPSNGHTYFLSVIISKQKSSAILGRKFQGNIEEINILKPPEPVLQVTPEYPQECREKKIEGKVTLEVRTDTKGNVMEVRVLQSVHPLLDLAAMDALKQWKYTPVIKDGRPIPVVFNVTVDFRWRKPSRGVSKHTRSRRDAALEKILDGCTAYCDRLTNSALYFVCEEIIKEKIFEYRKSSTEVFRTLGQVPITVYQPVKGPLKVLKNVYVYDYQLIKKGGDIQESRILLQENGEQKNERNAKLKTRRFYSERSTFGPVGLLSRSWQKLYDYKLIKSTKISGREAFIIEANPKKPIPGKPNHGKIWVDKEDFSILRIDIEMESLPGFEVIKEASERRGLHPYITVRHHYMVEKNGVGFPSRTTFKEAYGDREVRKLKRSELEITYTKYRFFTVTTEIKY